MKNNKGFTLVELLAVIIVLATISLVAVTSVSTSLYDRDEKEKAIYYLTSQYLYEHPRCSPWNAQDKAEELYQKYNPYNLVMVIEEEKINAN